MHKHEHEFLPAALEIQESPPSPIGRSIIWFIVAFFIIAIIWSVIGEVDIVATAQGKIIPSGHVKVIQPLEIGVVRKIYVEEGQEVKTGDVLVELDPTQTEADKGNLDKELSVARLELSRLLALREWHNEDVSSISKEQMAARYYSEALNEYKADKKDVQLQRDILEREISEHVANMAALDSEMARREAELASVKDQVNKLESTLPLITRRVSSLKKLSTQKLLPEHQYLELEEERITQRQDLASSRNRIKEISSAINEIRMRKLATNEEHIKNILSQQQEVERRLQAIEKELIKASQRNTQQKLTAPVDGVIQQLAIHTVGGVVTPAQQLMLVVPRNNLLEVEAFVQNKEIGFVETGQKAEIKVETFPFTRYGTIDAEIINISNDAIADENLGLVYAARVLMKESVIRVGEKLVNLTPGMAVTVEVKTGKRKLIEFLMSPLLRYKAESLRER